MLGTSLLHYKIIDKLGAGGMGVVYLAEDTKLNRNVALKFLSQQSAEDRELERFRNEARTAASLSHANISQIYSIEEADDQVFIVMEFVDGTELKDYIKENTLKTEEKENIARKVAEGLKAAHDQDILHRDIKSGNIMISKSGKVKVMDFGLARVADSAHITKPGEQMGTAAYMAPEQILGMEADFKTDIWSYGVVMYELFAGELPFNGLYEQAITYAIVDEEPKPLVEFKGIPEHIIAILDRCLEKDPGNRYESFDEIIADFEKHELTYKKKGKPKKKNNSLTAGAIFRYGIPAIVVILAGVFIIKDFGNGGLKASSSSQKLAIIPFTNIGEDLNNRILLDGVLETMTSKLSQIDNFKSALWVIPSSEIIANDIQSASQANKMFGVNLAITGSLQNIDDEKRLTLNLIDATNLRQIRSAVIDISLENISNLQTESVLQLMTLLEIEANDQITETINAGSSAEPGANEFYINGKGYLLRFTQGDNLENAIILFKQAVAKDRNFTLAHAALGESYWRMYQRTDLTTYVDSATNSLNTARGIEEELIPVQTTMALLFQGTGDYDAAIDIYDNILANDPRNDVALRGLGDAYKSKQEFSKAEQYYKQAISLKPDYWAGYEKLGTFYMSRSKYEEALEPYQQVISLTPNNHLAFSNLGNAYYYMNDWPKAREFYEKSLNIQPTAEPASNLGTVHYIEGNYTAAAEAYLQALELNPNQYIVWGNLASVQGILGNVEKEQEYYRTAIMVGKSQLDVNPNDLLAVTQIGVYYSDIGDKQNSIPYLEKAISIGSEYSTIVFSVASAYERLGDRDKALNLMEKALDLGYPLANILNQAELEDLVKDERFAKIID